MAGAEKIESFGDFLERTGVISGSDLEEATQTTVLFGGRLGTSLVEAGVFTIPELEEHLARYHGVDPLPREWLERPDPGAWSALPAELVQKHGAFPLAFEKRLLHVGMLDPRDTAVLDDLAFASGCLIAPHPIAECRFVQLVERAYGIRPSLRFQHLQREAEISRRMREPLPSAVAPGDEVREELGLTPLDRDTELVDAETYETTFDAIPEGAAEPEPDPMADAAEPQAPAQAPPGPTLAGSALPEPSAAPEVAAAAATAPPQPAPVAPGEPPPAEARPAVPRPEPAEIARLEKVLLTTLQREDVIRAGIRIAAAYAECASLFVVRNELASGACAWRDGEILEIDSVVVPAVSGGVLAEAVGEKRVVRAAPETQLDKVVARALGRMDAAEFVALPILLGGRVVNVLLVDTGSEPISQSAMSALGHLAPMIANAYERLIVARKTGA